MDCNPPGSSVHGDSPSKNTGVGCHALLQEVFPTQGLKPGLLHCRRILYQLSHKGSPKILEWVAYPFSSGSSWPRNQTGVSCTVGRFFTSWSTREAQSTQRKLFKDKLTLWYLIQKSNSSSECCQFCWFLFTVMNLRKEKGIPALIVFGVGVGISVHQDCCTKHRWGMTEAYGPPRKLGSPKSRCWHGWFLLKAVRKGSIPGLTLANRWPSSPSLSLP